MHSLVPRDSATCHQLTPLASLRLASSIFSSVNTSFRTVSFIFSHSLVPYCFITMTGTSVTRCCFVSHNNTHNMKFLSIYYQLALSTQYRQYHVRYLFEIYSLKSKHAFLPVEFRRIRSSFIGNNHKDWSPPLKNGICFSLSATNCLTKALRTLRRWRTLTRRCPVWDAMLNHEQHYGNGTMHMTSCRRQTAVELGRNPTQICGKICSKLSGTCGKNECMLTVTSWKQVEAAFVKMSSNRN